MTFERFTGLSMVWIGIGLLLVTSRLSWVTLRDYKNDRDPRAPSSGYEGTFLRLRRQTMRIAWTLLMLGFAVSYSFSPTPPLNWLRAPVPVATPITKPENIAETTTQKTSSSSPMPTNIRSAEKENNVTKDSQIIVAKSVFWPGVLFFGFLFIVGAGLLHYGAKLKTGGAFAKTAGTATMLISIALGSYSVLKVDLKLEPKLEAHLDSLFKIHFQQHGGFSPAHLMYLSGFTSGSEKMDREDAAKVLKYCVDNNLQARDGLLIVVGATDRVPLSPSLKRRYESNFGLARARAENVRLVLVKPPASFKNQAPTCGLSEDRVMALVSGPQHTEQIIAQKPSRPPEGNAIDRSVDIWAFWDQPQSDSNKKKEVERINLIPTSADQQQKRANSK